MAKNNMFSITEAANYCAIGRVTLWKFVKSGDLKASLTPGGHFRILKKDLESFMMEKGMYPLANMTTKTICGPDSGMIPIRHAMNKIISGFDLIKSSIFQL